ncbi:MAG TPA: family 1 encapsulin nanocompartment shell protein [Candidatus Avalokitesvara rifleensis]|uniref:family 1 encapsulin nanocompartment shell protein n=1 Tax=Candidatus Avalokitesvara rifleensis TaxID=3367620 RepID=UPI002713CD8A|nr:family 1 encapsulin nanocompartment shell protein [Candidatus Brocadiales bacterium]
MRSLKQFHILAVLFVTLVPFYFSQGVSTAFANGAKGAEAVEVAEASALPCVHPGPAHETEGSNLANITSEIRLRHEDWEKLNRVVHETAERYAVGRKFINVYGPLGTGVQCVPMDTYPAPSKASIDMLGESNEAVHSLKRDIAHLPLIYKDFWLYWRDIEAAHKCETPLDVSAAVAAAIATASREDDLIFNGSEETGTTGLLNTSNRQTVKINDWSAVGNGFQDVVAATEKLYSTGFYGPYALVLSPRLYAQISRVFDKTGRLEIEGIREIVKGGVHQSYAFKKDVALVVSMGSHNLDLAVGTNPHVEYWGPENLNHRFRVVESAVLRVKCAQAICTVE